MSDFELAPQQHGEVAQSVERETENLCVGGSIPSLATFHIKPSRTINKYRKISLFFKNLIAIPFNLTEIIDRSFSIIKSENKNFSAEFQRENQKNTQLASSWIA